MRSCNERLNPKEVVLTLCTTGLVSEDVSTVFFNGSLLSARAPAEQREGSRY